MYLDRTHDCDPEYKDAIDEASDARLAARREYQHWNALRATTVTNPLEVACMQAGWKPYTEAGQAVKDAPTVGAIVDDPCGLLRELFGNPFRPLPSYRNWLMADSARPLRIAMSVYSDNVYNRLSTLADALQSAGCGEQEVLEHFRSPGPHVRGCWALDALLGLR